MTLDEAKDAIRGGAYVAEVYEDLASADRVVLCAWFVREPGVPNLAARQPAIPQLSPPQLTARQAAEAGYTGDPCPTCGAFKLKRNGSCLLCDACGSTTGCS